MEKKLLDKVAIVTGGAQGLGQAICLRLAQEGCHVVVADLQYEEAEKTSKLIEGRKSFAVKVSRSFEYSATGIFSLCMTHSPRPSWEYSPQCMNMPYPIRSKRATRSPT